MSINVDGNATRTEPVTTVTPCGHCDCSGCTCCEAKDSTPDGQFCLCEEMKNHAPSFGP